MKRLSFMLLALTFSVVLFAKDIKTVVVTTQPQMHCASCESKIKGNIRFEKGVKQIETDIPNQTVTITYDADKTNEKSIIAAFKKIDYEATVVTPAPKAEAKSHCDGEKKCEMKSHCDGEKKSCCEGEKKCEKKAHCEGEKK